MAKTFDLSVLFRAVDKLSAPVRKMGKSIGDLTKPIKKVMRGFEQLRKKVGVVGRKMKDIGQDLSLKLTAPLALMGGLATKAAIDFESAFTGVRKTVSATEEEFGILRKQLMAMALELPLATEELFGIAEAAGQLGIQKKDIISFTKVMADLGATTNLTADEAATQLARFANITAMSQKDFDRLGSTIVDLGNNMATTEAEIVAMAMRLAGAGKVIGLSQANTVAFAAALSSVGIRAEAGGTAFSQVMKKIDKEIGTGSEKMKSFALISGKTVGGFEKQWEEDAAGALVDFVEGLDRVQKSGANVNIVLDELGFEGIRISDSLLRAAGAGDLMREALDMGSAAWEENNALTKEAILRYKTSAAQLTMAKNRAIQMAVSFGAVLVPALLKIIKFLEPVVDWLTKLGPVTKIVIVTIGVLVAAIPPLLLGLGMLAIAIGAITAPIAIIAASVTGLGLAAGLLIAYWKPVKDFFSDLFGFMAEQIQSAIASFTGLLPDWLKKKMGLGFAIERKEIVTPGGGTKGLIGTAGATGKTETDINIKLIADEGTTATVEKVNKKKGDAVVSVASPAYAGAL